MSWFIKTGLDDDFYLKNISSIFIETNFNHYVEYKQWRSITQGMLMLTIVNIYNKKFFGSDLMKCKSTNQVVSENFWNVFSRVMISLDYNPLTL